MFRVVDAAQETKKVLRPAHIAVRKTEISVVFFDAAQLVGEEASWSEATGRLGMLDLACFCDLDRLPHLYQWPCVAHSGELALPRSVQLLLGDLEVQQRAPTQCSERPAGANCMTIVSAGNAASSCMQLIRSMVARLDAADASEYMRVGEGLDINMAALGILSEHGCIALRESEFGEVEAALNLDSVRRDVVATASAPQRITTLPFHLGVEHATKQDLALQLCREGWRPVRGVRASHVPGGRLAFEVLMLARSRLYLVALLRCESIWQRGACEIRLHMPDRYYQVLLKRADLSILQALPDVDRMTNAQFAKLLDDDFVPGALPAVAGGPIVADDDANYELAELEDEPGSQARDATPRLAPALALEDVVGVVVAGMDVIRRAAAPVRAPGSEVEVRFDFWSHSSGIQRAYARCQCHRACFRYRQMNHFARREEAIAYLTAWAQQGPNLPREVHVSAFWEPDASDVASILQRILAR